MTVAGLVKSTIPEALPRTRLPVPGRVTPGSSQFVEVVAAPRSVGDRRQHQEHRGRHGRWTKETSDDTDGPVERKDGLGAQRQRPPKAGDLEPPSVIRIGSAVVSTGANARSRAAQQIRRSGDNRVMSHLPWCRRLQRAYRIKLRLRVKPSPPPSRPRPCLTGTRGLCRRAACRRHDGSGSDPSFESPGRPYAGRPLDSANRAWCTRTGCSSGPTGPPHFDAGRTMRTRTRARCCGRDDLCGLIDRHAVCRGNGYVRSAPPGGLRRRRRAAAIASGGIPEMTRAPARQPRPLRNWRREAQEASLFFMTW